MSLSEITTLAVEDRMNGQILPWIEIREGHTLTVNLPPDPNDPQAKVSAPQVKDRLRLCVTKISSIEGHKNQVKGHTSGKPISNHGLHHFVMNVDRRGEVSAFEILRDI